MNGGRSVGSKGERQINKAQWLGSGKLRVRDISLEFLVIASHT